MIIPRGKCSLRGGKASQMSHSFQGDSRGQVRAFWAEGTPEQRRHRQHGQGPWRMVGGPGSGWAGVLRASGCLRRVHRALGAMVVFSRGGMWPDLVWNGGRLLS